MTSTSPVRMSLQPMLERVSSCMESKKTVFSTSSMSDTESVSLIGKFEEKTLIRDFHGGLRTSTTCLAK